MTTKGDKYGFGGGIQLPKQQATPARRKVAPALVDQAVEAGEKLGFVDREPMARRKPGPKRKEPQDKVSIPGPKRVIDAYRAFCTEENLTLWQGLERLLADKDKS